MKKLFTIILCLMMLFIVPLSVSAEENVTPETEQPTQSEIQPSESEETTSEWDEVKDTISGAFVKWIEPNVEEIGVIVTLIGYGIMLYKKFKSVTSSMGKINNNTITISEQNTALMSEAKESINTAAGAVTGFEAQIVELLTAYQQTAEDKVKLEKELVEIKNYLKTSTDANIEFANELAELLGLSNIPNYKKEEIGSRHLAAVNAIIEAEAKAESVTVVEEVKTNDGEAEKD